MKTLHKILSAIALFLLCMNNYTTAQLCDGNVPSFVADLTGNPDSLWISPSIIRNGNCCGITSSDRCVEFQVILDPKSEGIIFDIYSGAIPPGALFYQLECGTVTAVGEPLCLKGVGPHKITFCKPGNNDNEYSIKAVPKPDVSPDVIVNDGCTDRFDAYRYTDSTIIWTSVSPGARGDYDSLLSCKYGCPTTYVTGVPGAPQEVIYEVCGYPEGKCGVAKVCNTVKATFNPTMGVDILPENPTICFGATATSISANGYGGTPPYSYTWSTGETTQYIDVGVGTYYVTMEDATDCPPVMDTVVVTEFTTHIRANAGPDIAVCKTDPTAQLSGTILAASGGVWSTSGTGTFNPSVTDLNASYTPSQSDIANGKVSLALTTTGNGTCPAHTDSIVIYITGFKALLSSSLKNASCNGKDDGQITIGATGSQGPYSFAWNNGQSSSAIANLSPGNYSVIITDTIGCDTNLSFQITEPEPLVTSVDSSSDATCFGASNGKAMASASGGTPPYIYLWNSSPAITGPVAEGLTTGTFAVLVSDANGCVGTASVSISQPLQLTPVIGNLDHLRCKGDGSGAAEVAVSGGVVPYTYQWNDPLGQTAKKAESLDAGNYTVLVTDANGCDTIISVDITEPGLLEANISNSVNIRCNGGSNGEATVSATGGTAPFSYNWNDPGTQNTAKASGLTSGTFQATITDANGCTATASVTLQDPPKLQASATGSNVSCFGGSDGSGQVIASGGTPPYTYSWNSNPVQNTNNALNLPAAGYIVTVKDNLGCETKTGIVITQPDKLTLTEGHIIDVKCNGIASGEASVNVTGGVPPYSYLWNDQVQQNTAIAGDLIAGDYIVTVTDDNGCVAKHNISIDQPVTISSSIASHKNVSCTGGSDGTATALATGGNGEFTYTWNTVPAQVGATVKNLPEGRYMAIITDKEGCLDTISVDIIEPTPVNIELVAAKNTTCTGGSDGMLEVKAGGGTPGYSYLWSSNPSQYTAKATGLPAGKHTVLVKDANGCEQRLSASIVDPVQNIEVTAYPQVICQGDTTELTAVVSGGKGNLKYEWSHGLGTGELKSVQPDETTTYTITITDSCGVSSTGEVTVTVHNTPEVLIAAERTNICAEDTIRFVNNTVADPGSRYLWNFGDGNSSADRDPEYAFVTDGPKTVKLTVFSPQGCKATGFVTSPVQVLPKPTANFIAAPYETSILFPDINFEDRSSDVIGWEWTMGDGDTTKLQHPSHTYGLVGDYDVTLTVVNEFGCYDAITKQVSILPTISFFVPNSFSPNGDGVNDTFSGMGTGIKEYHMYIIDRWGETVYETDDIGKPWDGRSNGGREVSKRDTYVYVIDVKDVFDKETRYVGHVNLIK